MNGAAGSRLLQLRAFWLLSLVVALLLAVAVWWILPRLPFDPNPFAPAAVRALLVAVILLAWGGVNLWREMRARQSNAAMVDALAADQAGAAEGAELARRFAQATAALRRQPVGQGRDKRLLRDLPWYALIGPPRAGKTTALVQSGLRFVSTVEGGAPEPGTVSDTRQVEWYFTDEAVLLDTAGRYTLQEGTAADKAGWEAFLDLLRRHRPAAPLNGVLVVLEAALFASGPEAIERHARLVRARLAELGERLGVRLPVYLVLTKADLVAGFEELLGGLDPAAREQVLGFTLPWRADSTEPPARGALEAELEAVARRLEELLPRRLPELGTPETRARALGFPVEFRALGPGLGDFIDRVFRGTLLDAPPPLRGIYVTSAIQAGSPVERLAQALARRLGLPAPPPPPVAGRRSYFLTRLLRDVIFPEAGLVARDPTAERRAALAWTGGAMAMALVLLGLVALWGMSWRHNLARLATLQAAAADYGSLAAPPVGSQTVTDDDPRPVVQPLDRLRRTAGDVAVDLDTGQGGEVIEAHAEPATARFGLSLRRDLEGYERDLYWHGLARLLLPRLMLRLERQLAGNPSEAQAREALKVYLLLTGEAPLDPAGTALVRDRTIRDLQARFPGQPEIVERLRPHLDALLAFLKVRDPQAIPAPGLEPDRTLIARAKALSARTPLAQRAYASLQANPAFAAHPPWRVESVAGTDARLLRSKGNGALTASVPWLFTAQGFKDGFVPALDPVVDRILAAERPLAGPQPPAAEAAARNRLRAEVAALYQADYAARWQALLDDLGLAPPAEDLRTLQRDLATLGGPNSPLVRVLRAVLAEVRPGDATAPEPAADAALSGRPIAERFRWLAALVEGDGSGEPPLARATSAFTAAAQALEPVASAPNPQAELVARGGLGGVTAALATAATGLPATVAAPLQSLAGTLAQRSSNRVGEEINRAWRDTAGFCRALTARFPFTPASADEVGLDDFGKLLGPGGALDSFFTTYLARHVTTDTHPWRLTGDIGLSPSAPRVFEEADSLRRRFFIGASPRPEAGFTLRLVELQGADLMDLNLDGRQVSMTPGSPPQRLRWPGDNPGCRLALESGQTPPAEFRTEGDWAWFRLLRIGGAAAGGSDRLLLHYAAAGRSAALEVKPTSLDSPFDLGALARFRCPDRL